jgi:hypothetical protein
MMNDNELFSVVKRSNFPVVRRPDRKNVVRKITVLSEVESRPIKPEQEPITDDDRTRIWLDRPQNESPAKSATPEWEELLTKKNPIAVTGEELEKRLIHAVSKMEPITHPVARAPHSSFKVVRQLRKKVGFNEEVKVNEARERSPSVSDEMDEQIQPKEEDIMYVDPIDVKESVDAGKVGVTTLCAIMSGRIARNRKALLRSKNQEEFIFITKANLILGTASRANAYMCEDFVVCLERDKTINYVAFLECNNHFSYVAEKFTESLREAMLL